MVFDFMANQYFEENLKILLGSHETHQKLDVHNCMTLDK